MARQQMKTSREGKIAICCREAIVLAPYMDGGHYSAGMGHNDASLKPGDVITMDQAFKWFDEDVAKWEDSLNRLLKVEVSQSQFDAMISLHHQSGNRYVPAVAALCNSREFAVAADLFPLCDRNKAGVKVDGLGRRRVMEQTMFVSGDYGDLTTIPFWKGDPHTTPRLTYTVRPEDFRS